MNDSAPGTTTQLQNQVAQLKTELQAERLRHQKIELLLQARLRLSEADPGLSLDTLLRQLLNEAEDLTGSCVGFFHLFSEDLQTISLQTWSDRTLHGPCTALADQYHYNIDVAGIWVDCVQTRKPVIHNDYKSVPHKKGLPPGHVNLVRDLVIPIFHHQKIVAIIGVGNKAAPYTVEDIDHLSILGDLAWDIFLRKREEQRLQESESRFRKLINDIPLVSIQGYGSDGRVRFWNPASESLYGYSEEEAMGKSLLELIIPPEMQEEVREAVSRMAKTGETIPPAELTLQHKDGSKVDVFSSHALIYPTHGEPELFCVDVDLGERKKIEENLAAALQEKEVLIKEVHHRVKNNLAAVVGLLEMQAHLPLDAATRQILIELVARIRSMALAHEHLYQAESLANISMQQYLEALLYHLHSALPAPHINFQVTAPEVESSLDIAIPCGLIVNELLTNAIKYAFPESTSPQSGQKECRVTINMHQHEGIYTLQVSDNGIGLPDDLDQKKNQSLGMMLVRMLGEHQLGGRLAIDTSQGTTMTLTFAPGKRHAHEQSLSAHR